MQTLTLRQAEILAFIQEKQATNGMPPTRTEIAEHFCFRSTYAASKHLQALARKGVLELLPGASRGIRLLRAPEAAAAGLPVVGRVAAGAPLLAQECIEAHYALDPGLFRPRADYLLRVRGESMRDAGILDGDLLAVHKTPQAANGQIVVARLEGEVTVKRFQREAQQVRLLPENPDFSPILVDAGMADFCIEGVAVGCLRCDLAP